VESGRPSYRFFPEEILVLRVLIVGAGLMGAQIGCEYALGGHEVMLFARNRNAARARLDSGLDTVERLGLADREAVKIARGHVSFPRTLDECSELDLIVESLPEELELKVGLLGPVAERSHGAILATNTSSLSVTEIGRRVGAPGRTLGTHYWNPPLLMPLVELVAGTETAATPVDDMEKTLIKLGKRPLRCADVPGFAWNRLQVAVLREAAWLVENGVVTPATVDAILADGLARRWRRIGFFDSIAVAGVETWERASSNLLPELSAATTLGSLRALLDADHRSLGSVADRRDRGLAADLLEDRRADE
jgi:3-hydroxybutyryl-CoA dehydrogenase